MSTPLRGADGASSSDRHEKSDIRLVSRISSVLRFLSEQAGGVSLGQIAKGTGIPRGTIQRLVDSLEVEGMVARGDSDSSIRLGLEIARLGLTMGQEVTTFFRPILEDLARQSGETVDLTLAHPRGATVLDQIASPHTLRVVSRPGQILPLHATASGKVHLQQMGQVERLRALAQDLPAYTALTVTDRDRLLAMIDTVPAGEPLYDTGEYAEGICAVSLDIGVTPLGNVAIALSLPAARFEEGRANCAALLRQVRMQLSR